MDKLSQILLITSTGLVGGNILSVLRTQGYAFTQTYYPSVDRPQGLPVDISDAVSVNKLFDSVKPAIVILSAALTNVEFCQANRDTAWKVNVIGPQNVAVACKKHKAKLAFFSSDYVFDGKAGPYSETAAPNPINVYGDSKLAAEAFMQDILDDHLIIRTTIVYGYEDMAKNFCYRLLSTLKAGQQIKVPDDQIGSPTYAYNLAEVVVDLLAKNKQGLYNVVGKDALDRYAFARRVCAVFGLDEKLLIPVATRDLGQKAPRPLMAGLRIDKVSRDSSVAIMGIDAGLQSFKKELYG